MWRIQIYDLLNKQRLSLLIDKLPSGSNSLTVFNIRQEAVRINTHKL